MKTVVNNETVATYFRWQNQNYASNPGKSFYFKGEEIFSYGPHFCVAKLARDSSVLISERTYSVSTAKHISLVENEMYYYKKIYCADPKGSHDFNYDFWLKSAEETIVKLSKSRRPEIYLEKLKTIAERASKYSKFFKEITPIELKTALKISSKESSINYFANKAKNKSIIKSQQDKIIIQALVNWGLIVETE